MPKQSRGAKCHACANLFPGRPAETCVDQNTKAASFKGKVAV